MCSRRCPVQDILRFNSCHMSILRVMETMANAAMDVRSSVRVMGGVTIILKDVLTRTTGKFLSLYLYMCLWKCGRMDRAPYEIKGYVSVMN